MTIANKAPSTSPMKADSDDGWRAESDLRTLIEAEKIKKDKGRLRAALAKRDEQRGHLSSIRSPRN